MSKVCALIRHGAYHQLKNTPSAMQPFALTLEGEHEVRRQARLFGEWLSESGYTLDSVVDASSLLRAWQTAHIYVEELGQFFNNTPQVVCHSELCERSVGAVANLPLEEIERILELDPRFNVAPKGWKSDSHYCLPFDGAESLLQAGQRVANHIMAWQTDETEKSSNRSIKLIVGHGASIRHASFHLNVIKFCDIKRLSMHYGHPVVLDFVGDKVTQLFGDWKQRQTHDVPD
ncbi:2,3-bisphosphoglycerate-dependent phosphoglycerate mutase [Marinomonas gallaica]|uniref:phosphoglycerate mutase (2,3-diphosphoglycerate-dependent) n=1 Tax=Marinomonas gallaica TaxID=1806667 RepID=A0A1C3JTJ9_9GAMM|nr:histidine phosphatase family protein [Marinomonas gallaica]SBT18558.1 2,3-bisphosphoglycerate-dependent phosphoglycerate mutase [Marinomonas gallaica]SBT21513.1 2,3-bisphosphoglycerate-dependent phosphoglycerate mutase [Marinomonas gallaica]